MGLRVRETSAMRITLPSGTPAELAVPTDPPARGLVLAPDVGGLRPLFDDRCAQLAAYHGWAVCAPEPFPGREHLSLEERLGAVGGLDDAAVLADLAEAADATGAEPVAVLGFCMGGMFAMKAAGTARFDRAVSFYGMIRVPDAWCGPTQGEPLAAVTAEGASPVLAICGTDDPWLPAADIDDLEAAGATVIRYPGAEHGFAHDPSRPAHRPADAADAWRRAIDFLG
ncbi:dienelactone hydrolase family protein [soil metagenome]